jgi:crossover junction endodeoxyribonuclease RuvC
MRVLGIDPGFATTGVAVVERRNSKLHAVVIDVLRTSADQPHADRLASLWTGIRGLIETHAPDVVSVERLFFNSNVSSAIGVGQASGVALAAAAQSGLEVYDYTPPEVKASVVGVGSATKHQVQAMVAALLSLPTPPKPADAADACALAICHINRSGLASAIARQVAR